MQTIKLLIWILILIGLLITIFYTQYWVYGEPYNRWVSAFIYPITRIIWALNMAAIIWMCITGNGGFVNKFLSYKAFTPLSRLTYSVYLTHVWIVWYYWASIRTLFDLNKFSFAILSTGIVLISFTIGAIFSLLFESPFLVFLTYLKRIINEKNYVISDSKEMEIFVENAKEN